MFHLMKKCVRYKRLNFENKIFACFDVHKFRMSDCRICVGSPLWAFYIG